jgi:glycosyltransferase involved in cell wall biosynthesis
MIDNSPNVVLEALARNVVVAASDSGGTGEIPQKLGLKTFRFGDVRNFVSVLSQCLANPRLTKSQSNHLESLISETTHATQLIKIYESII